MKLPSAPPPQMPYLSSTLRPQGELLSGYSLSGNTGLPNDIAAISGQPPNASTEANCSTNAEFPPKTAPNKSGVITASGCLYPVEALTIADQLSSGGFQWKAYLEDMAGAAGKPENCVHPSSGSAESPTQGGYAARQNPFVYFNSLLELGACASSDVPLTELGTDLGTINSTPNYSFIAPSLCDAGVPGECPTGAPSGASGADAFLSKWVPQILASSAYQKDGLLMITFDEALPSPTLPKVGTLLLSPFVTHNTTDASPYNPYSLLRSTEDLFGLTHLGAAEGSTVSSFAPALLGKQAAISVRSESSQRRPSSDQLSGRGPTRRLRNQTRQASAQQPHGAALRNCKAQLAQGNWLRKLPIDAPK